MTARQSALGPIDPGEDLKQKTYRAIKQALLAGALATGPLYNEKTLAQQLGVSRTPVREALLMLVSEGWARYRPRRGIEFLHPTAQDALHFFQLRQAIEAYVVEQIAGRVAPESLLALERIVVQQAEARRREDWVAYTAKASVFHTRLVELLGNPRFTELYARLSEQFQLFGREAIAASRDPGERLTEHRQLLAALRDGDGHGARAIVLSHIERTMEALGLTSGNDPNSAADPHA